MSDSLKSFIENHRAGFDDKQPSNRVWNKIESGLPERNVTFWSNVDVWRAAAFLFLALSVYLMVSPNISQSIATDRAKQQVEFSDLEDFYNGQIADKIELIRNIQESNDVENFAQDLQKLDAMYQVLREQMKAHPSEKIKDALILNMLVRIDLLNQQIKNMEDAEKKSEKVTI